MKTLYLLGAATAAMLPTLAVAQDQPAQPLGTSSEIQPRATESGAPLAPEQAERSGQRTIEDIIVTAQRRDEALQDVPVAVTVFSSEDRDRLGIRTIQDFSNFTPGLTFSSSLDRLSLRGIGRLTNTIGSDPGVAIYNDGFYTASNAEASKSPMFVERVEFLRGPQGTLYGRNSIGGSVNVISKRPTDQLSAEWRGTLDNLSLISEGYISGPIADGLKARVSVQMGPRKVSGIYEQTATTPLARDEGFFNRFLVEAQLQYSVSDATSLWFKYSHAEWRDSNPLGVQVEPYLTTEIAGANNGSLVPSASFQYAVANPSVDDPRRINTNTPNRVTLSNNHNFVANIDTQVSGVAIRYVGGYSQYDYQGLSDLDGTAQNRVTTSFGSAPILGLAAFGAANAFRTYSYNPTYVQDYQEHKKYYSNEVTLSNVEPGAFNWIVGGYQFHEDYFQPVTWFVDSDGSDTLSQRIAAPLCLAPVTFAVQPTCEANPQRLFYRGSGDLETDSYAGFGQVDYEPVAGLKLTAGLRYSTDLKKGLETYRIVQWQPAGASVYCTLAPGANPTVVGFGACGAAAAGQDLTQFVLNTSMPGTARRNVRDRWNGFSWRLGVDYKLDADTLVYGSYSRGLKAGGFNLGVYADFPDVEKEEVDAFELGLKSKPLEILRLNLTSFYYDYRNPQIPVTVGRPGTTLTTTNFFNIPKTRSYGVEVESALNITPEFEINANYSFNDTEIRSDVIDRNTGLARLLDDEGTAGNIPQSVIGNRLPAASKHKIAISALYDIELPAEQRVFLAASYVYRSDAFYSIFNSAISRTPGWDQVDARITYVDPLSGLTVIGFVRNLFDTLGYDGAASAGADRGFRQIYSYTLPRQYGIELQAKF